MRASCFLKGDAALVTITFGIQQDCSLRNGTLDVKILCHEKTVDGSVECEWRFRMLAEMELKTEREGGSRGGSHEPVEGRARWRSSLSLIFPNYTIEKGASAKKYAPSEFS